MILKPSGPGHTGRRGAGPVIDCATRKVVGWAMADNYRTPGS
jgi:transposase InsO family protein